MDREKASWLTRLHDHLFVFACFIQPVTEEGKPIVDNMTPQWSPISLPKYSMAFGDKRKRGVRGVRLTSDREHFKSKRNSNFQSLCYLVLVLLMTRLCRQDATLIFTRIARCLLLKKQGAKCG
jgi:hypothetical protein